MIFHKSIMFLTTLGVSTHCYAIKIIILRSNYNYNEVHSMHNLSIMKKALVATYSMHTHINRTGYKSI